MTLQLFNPGLYTDSDLSKYYIIDASPYWVAIKITKVPDRYHFLDLKTENSETIQTKHLVLKIHKELGTKFAIHLVEHENADYALQHLLKASSIETAFWSATIENKEILFRDHQKPEDLRKISPDDLIEKIKSYYSKS